MCRFPATWNQLLAQMSTYISTLYVKVHALYAAQQWVYAPHCLDRCGTVMLLKQNFPLLNPFIVENQTGAREQKLCTSSTHRRASFSDIFQFSHIRPRPICCYCILLYVSFMIAMWVCDAQHVWCFDFVFQFLLKLNVLYWYDLL